MKIYLRPELADEFVDTMYRQNNERPHAAEDWSAGMTTLIGDLRKAWYRRHGVVMEETGDFKLTVSLGSINHLNFAPEDCEREVALRATVDVDPFISGGVECRFGDITGYADWIEYAADAEGNEIKVVSELKNTRSSSGKPVNEHYIEQLAGNCWLAGTNWGRLYVVYVAGNYKPPTPVVKVYEIYFTDDELDLWGIELQRRLNVLLRDYPPSEEEHQKWEYKYCPLKDGELCCGKDSGRAMAWFSNFDIDGLLDE